MRRGLIRAAVVMAVMGAGCAFAADAAPTLKVIKTIPTGSTGRWDYICVDSAARRVYVPRSTHVQVVDLDKSEVIGDIPKTGGVHGVALGAGVEPGVCVGGAGQRGGGV